MIDNLIDALAEYNKRSTETALNAIPPFIYATWIAAESVDSNLSHIRLADGTDIRGVPRNRDLTGLTAGVTVLCANPGPDKPLLIAFIPVGDITKYEAP